MATLSQVAAARVKPADTVIVPVTAFAPTWERRPKSDVCIGLRLVPHSDLEDGRGRAAKKATERHQDANQGDVKFQVWADAYHDELIRWIVARGTCDPNDVSKPWPGWSAAPESIVRDALTAEGAGMIFDRWEQMRIASDPSVPPITTEEIGALLDELVGGALEVLPSASATRVRRLLRFCLDELQGK